MTEIDLLSKVKLSLSIVASSTTKDAEIEMWINAGKLDLKRQKIDVDTLLSNNDDLLIGAIIMYVKANFGMTDIKEKELAESRYKILCTNLSLSEDYRGGNDGSNGNNSN